MSYQARITLRFKQPRMQFRRSAFYLLQKNAVNFQQRIAIVKVLKFQPEREREMA